VVWRPYVSCFAAEAGVKRHRRNMKKMSGVSASRGVMKRNGVGVGENSRLVIEESGLGINLG